MAAYRPVDPRQSFPELEERILARWREHDVFHRSLAQREGAPVWSFYEGPPTANGKPGSHHVLSRVFKDIYPRYRTMRGHLVPRKAGWDCHGLPVELEVERELGISSKAEIEAYGIAEFNQRCRESVFRYVEEWNRMTERIGFWIDLDDAYATLTNDYIESVWWSLRRIWDDGRLYEAHKVVPYCPRDGTALSSHEVAQGYEEVEDPSVYVKLPVKELPGEGNPLEPGDQLLVWTTTPWTLISNAAVAVGPEIEYVRVREAGGGGAWSWSRAALVERVLGEGAEVLDRFPGSALAGTAYEPPFDYITDYGPRGHTVLEADFVATDEGTGLVHTAIAFGEEDFRLGEQYGITLQNPVLADGTFDERIADFAGQFVKDADPAIVEALRDRGRLLRAERYRHSYPHCWRCGTPLLYYAKSSWYVRTTDVRDRMLAENETIGWHPEHIKHGRFGKWLEGNVDWALSRERYWGTPLPIWECQSEDCEERFCAGSVADLRERGGAGARRPPPPLHRRGHAALRGLRRRDAPRPGHDRRLVRLGLDAVRAVPLPVRGRGVVQRALPCRVHQRGDRPDPRLVLLPAGDLGAGLRPHQLPELRRPGPDPGPRGPEDVQEPGQHRRPVGGDRPPRRRRLPLVLPRRPAALGRLPLLHRHGRRGRAPVHAHALEHVLVLGAVRERRGARAHRVVDVRGSRGRRRSRQVGAVPAAGNDRRP